MDFKDRIYKLRKDVGMTQEQFAEAFNVSKQAVQKWERGVSYPEIAKLMEISKRFDISLDTLLMDRDARTMDEVQRKEKIVPNYSALHTYELYDSAVVEEYRQSVDEGLDIEVYKDLFSVVSKLPKGEIKKQLGDVVYQIVSEAKQREDYPYNEPSELSAIRRLRKPYKDFPYDGAPLEDKVLGAWMGRVCGCMLGKSVEGIRTRELIPLLKETNNYPMHRYILRSDVDGIDTEKYHFPLKSVLYADIIDAMPVDDDTNYTVMAQEIIRGHGRDFTPDDVAQAWMHYQSKNSYFTAERVAFCNFIKGYGPPDSAVYKNPYREWIGAQIRADYYGYICPGDPEQAAEMAWRDASISHVKNGIYGAMFVAAMLAAAAVTDELEEILLAGLAQIPCTSRFYEDIMSVLEGYRNGVSQERCFEIIHEKYNEYTHWCHTNSNAMIVAASLLYGQGDFGKSICMAVQAAFDTDCNGATVGSVLGMAKGIGCIPDYWQKPFHDRVETSIFGIGTVSITKLVQDTMEHIAK